MATIAELNTKLDELQATVDATQARIATGVAALDALITDLQAQIAAGLDVPQETMDKIQAISDDLSATPDAA